ncbi:hypothetical protein RYX36_033988, partial [Vicia faba]
MCIYDYDVALDSAEKHGVIFDILSDFSWQYFGLKEDQVPLIVIQQIDGKKFFMPNLKPDHLAAWVKEYK